MQECASRASTVVSLTCKLLAARTLFEDVWRSHFVVGVPHLPEASPHLCGNHILRAKSSEVLLVCDGLTTPLGLKGMSPLCRGCISVNHQIQALQLGQSTCASNISSVKTAKAVRVPIQSPATLSRELMQKIGMLEPSCC